jgi:hypothetical protein
MALLRSFAFGSVGYFFHYSTTPVLHSLLKFQQTKSLLRITKAGYLGLEFIFKNGGDS